MRWLLPWLLATAVTAQIQRPSPVGFDAITLETPLAVTEGGTGADNAADARTNLGIDVIESNLATFADDPTSQPSFNIPDWWDALDIATTATTYTRAVIDALLDAVVKVEDLKYPVFVLTPPVGYTDFELKASDDNYVSGDLLLYYHSPGVLGSEVGDEPVVYHTDSGLADPRTWVTLPAGTSIAANLTDGNAVAGGIIVVVTDITLINSYPLENISWVIRWFTASSGEEDASNRQIWRPLTPTRYSKEIPTP